MSNTQSTARRIRWCLLVGAGLCWFWGIVYLVNLAWPQGQIVPFLPDHDAREGYGLQGVMGCMWKEWSYWCFFAFCLGVFLLTQWFFLCPRGNRRLYVSATGRPMGLSLGIAALMAALLSVALLATVLQITGTWKSFADHWRWEWTDSFVENGYPLPPLLALLAAWAIWIVVFFIYFRQRDHFNWAGKILRGLIGGSILELLIAGPAQALSSEQKDCYCARGSYTGLVLGGTVLFWCFGPGIALLFIRERQRRQQLAGHFCLRCGYGLRASTERCPECGLPMPPAAAGSDSAAP